MDIEIAKLKSLYKKLEGIFPAGSSVLIELSNIITGLSFFRNKNRITPTNREIVFNGYTPEDVLSTCASVFQCSVEEIKGKIRKEHIVKARRMVAYVLHVKLGLTLKFSGDFINKDHSTVLHSSNKVTNLLEKKFTSTKSVESKLDFIIKAKHVLEILQDILEEKLKK